MYPYCQLVQDCHYKSSVPLLKSSSDSNICKPVFQIKDGRWHQTHFLFQMQDPNLLPIVDVYNVTATEPGALFHLEVGSVCFL